VKDGRTSDEPPGSQIMVARPKSLVPGPNSSSAASPFTGSQHLLKALRKRVKVSLGILRNSRADLSIHLSWCRACQSRPVRLTHRLESRMREIRTSGSEGGVGSIPHSYLYKGLKSRRRVGPTYLHKIGHCIIKMMPAVSGSSLILVGSSSSPDKKVTGRFRAP